MPTSRPGGKAALSNRRPESGAQAPGPGREHKDDWPALALALQLECAIWTEDQDFFGIGIATWTSNTVVRYLES